MTGQSIFRTLTTWRDELAPNGKGKQLNRDQREDLHRALQQGADAILKGIEELEARKPKPRRRHPSNIGTAAQVIEWVINHSPDGPAEQDAFLRQWSEGDVGEWPDYLLWLDQQEEDAGSAGALLDPGVGSIAAQERLEILTNGQRDTTSCGTGFLADERALRFIERHGWPKEADMLDWLTATARAAGSGANLAALKNARTTFGDDDLPF